VLVALFVMGSKKEHMLLNVNKTTRLYKIEDHGVVENDYLFLFANTDSKKHTYTFEIEGKLKDKIEIVRPKEPFSIAAGKKRKKVVILRTKEKLADNARKDVPLPVTIKAYAVDDKEKIMVERHTVFVYPRSDVLKK